MDRAQVLEAFHSIPCRPGLPQHPPLPAGMLCMDRDQVLEATHSEPQEGASCCEQGVCGLYFATRKEAPPNKECVDCMRHTQGGATQQGVCGLYGATGKEAPQA